ncbi:transposase [Myxococcus sp. CA033]|nr:transposase [Myxococcus sp. CA033]
MGARSVFPQESTGRLEAQVLEQRGELRLGNQLLRSGLDSQEREGELVARVEGRRHRNLLARVADTEEAVLRQLPAWFDDYNHVHPHKGLKMRSPIEYRRAVSPIDCVRFDGSNSTVRVGGEL